MSKSKKLLSQISKMTVGAITGATLLLAPQAVFADHHDEKTEEGDKGCEGENCGDDHKGCGGH
jgi:hypothetical protein